MKQLHYVFVRFALEGEQILHNVVIIIVPLQFQNSGVILSGVERYSKEKGVSWLGSFRLLAPEQGTVQQVINMLVVDLKE